jgi:hypothetical protein
MEKPINFQPRKASLAFGPNLPRVATRLLRTVHYESTVNNADDKGPRHELLFTPASQPASPLPPQPGAWTNEKKKLVPKIKKLAFEQKRRKRKLHQCPAPPKRKSGWPAPPSSREISFPDNSKYGLHVDWDQTSSANHYFFV